MTEQKIDSSILFELRNIDSGYQEFTKEEITKSKEERRALFIVKDCICVCIYIPEDVSYKVIVEGMV